MKYFYLLLLSLLTIATAKSQFPGYVIVKGYVKNTNGAAVANHAVNIVPDSITSSCALNHTRYTNANGYYADTLACTTPIYYVIVRTANCNGTYLTNFDTVPLTKVVENNFTICLATTTVCHASFTANDTLGGIVYFNSSASTASTGSTITERNWSFGDGSSLSGNVVSPTHTYTAAGTYTVRLIISTSSQCRDTVYNTVHITLAPISCQAYFYDTVAGLKVYFQSGYSSTGAGDSIVQRRWTFGDPNSSTNILTGNVVNPTHTYAANGTYTVCLKITSARGCSDSICKSVVINNVPTSCVASFTYSHNLRAYTFNSSASVGSSSTDPIVRRKWVFGDGDTLGGNVISPVHTYAQNGNYSVCLYVYTQLGCTSVACKAINIVDSGCHAAFTYNIPTPNPVSFFNASTAGSGSTITQYYWKFGDSSNYSTLANPTHQFPGAGTYTVCLTIATSTGCQSTECKQVVIGNTKSCHAYIGINTPTPITTGSPVAFSSSQSYTAAGDSIMQRFWSWGDGSSSTQLNGYNSITHTYSSAATYTVTLIIVSASGCRDTAHATVTVAGVAVSCHAYFIDSVSGGIVHFNSIYSTTGTGDSIVERHWTFGDPNSSSNTLGGNVVAPSHTYSANGTYTVCLKITSARGCHDSICKTVAVTGVQANCVAYFVFTTISLNAAFSSTSSSAPTGDSIIHRYWSFGDSISLGGNVVSPYHTYQYSGAYNVCLTIVTAKGCTKTLCKTVTVTITCPVPSFTTTINGNVVTFNSSNITVLAGDTIIQRQWQFGDSTDLGGNVVSPSHTYAHAGTYQVCLAIHTSRGCVSTACSTVVITNVPSCVALFKYVKASQKALQFQSGGSMAAPGDSIVSRKWTFGDGTTLIGNVVNPLKTYQAVAIYNVCLRIQTASGCVKEVCQTIRVGDSAVIVDSAKKVEIISLNPNPVTSQFTTIIWSKYSGVSAQLAILDIYGITKWTVTKSLLSGNNAFVIPTSALLAGPYTFRVTTLFGIKSRKFYKL